MSQQLLNAIDVLITKIECLTECCENLASQSSQSTSHLPSVCLLVDGVNQYGVPQVNTSNGVETITYINSDGSPIAGDITVADDCDCKDCDVCPDAIQFGYHVLNGALNQDWRYALGVPATPNFIGLLAGGSTATQIAAQMNAEIANAIPPQADQDYSGTVFGVSPLDPEWIIVVSGLAPPVINLRTPVAPPSTSAMAYQPII